MKKTHSVLSLFVVLILLVSCLWGVDPMVAQAEKEERKVEAIEIPDIIDPAEAMGYIARLKDQEPNLYTLVFRNIDGTNTMRVFGHPVKYVDEKGEIRDISLRIVPMNDGGFISLDHEIETIFGEDLSDGVSLKYEDVMIRMFPKFDFGSISEAILGNDGKTVSYKISEESEIVYKLTCAGFKEDIVVEEYTGKTEYTFSLLTNGLSLCENMGAFSLVDGNGSIKATIGDIIIFSADERNNAQGFLTYETVRENQEYRLTIHLDADYLADEKTTYPIRIDPSIEINYSGYGAGAIEDVTINSLTGSDGSSGSLYVGKRETNGKSRILMRFPALNMDYLPGRYQINTASVEIRDLMCESAAMQVYCHVFTGNTWTESTATWANVNANSFGILLSSKSISQAKGLQLPVQHRYSFDIVEAVRGWKDGSYNKDKGIIFMGTAALESGSGYQHKTFASYNRASFKPSLTVTYRILSNVASINSSSYFTNNRTIVANYAYRFAYTPSVTDKYSFWTRGSTNTHISIYGNSAYTINVGADDNSGHNLNACETATLTAGHTYYVFVQGSTPTTTGTYDFKLQRGLPESGNEEANNINIFNNAAYIWQTNCYTYALDAWLNPVTGNGYGSGGINPGGISGNSISLADLSNPTIAKNNIVAAVKQDCVAWGGTVNDFYEVTEDAMVPTGFYKVCLLLKPGVDYHWYRQVSDLSGKWAHKPGTTSAIAVDSSGYSIFVPTEANWGIYTYFLGYFALKPPSTSAKSSLNEELTLAGLQDGFGNQILSNIRSDIYLNDFLSLVVDETTREEVYSQVGAAHAQFGCGYIGDRYYTVDGYDIVVYYHDGVVEQVRRLNIDGTYSIIIQ